MSSLSAAGASSHRRRSTAADDREAMELAKIVLQQKAAPTFEYVRVADIRIDEYQRDLKQEKVAKIVREYRVDLLQPVDVSRRADGTMWCIDGQHRLAALRALGHTVVGAMIHSGLSEVDEAILFWLFQKNRAPLITWDAFNARLHGHEPAAVGIVDTVKALDLTVGRGTTYDIVAVAALDTVWRWGAHELLLDTLSTIKTIWPLANRRFERQVITGMATILRHYAKLPTFDRNRLLQVLSANPPSAYIALAKDARGQQVTDKANYAFARVVRSAYNARLGPKRQLPPLKGLSGRALPGDNGN